MVEAFQCFGPQGVAGCGFESHLESMYKALAKARTRSRSRTTASCASGDPVGGGHLGRDRLLVQPGHEGDLHDNKVFWDDPEATWRRPRRPAGTRACDCHAENYDVKGQPGASDADAVLHPVSRYINQLQQIEDTKRGIVNDAEVLVAVIGGVPVGYEDGGEVTYSSVASQTFLDDFGIAPGCTLGEGTAVPPVRMREFAEAFQVGEDRNMFSICQDDYSKALEAIADKIRDQIKPACMPECVKDVDPTTPILDPECRIEEELLDGSSVSLPLCVKSGGEWAPPAGVSACYVALVDDEGLTPGTDDDLSEACQDVGWNLEFKLYRDGPAPAGSTVTATCVLSEKASVDCPGLG
jgi:hypothetical protein